MVRAGEAITVQRYPIAYLRRSAADATDPGDVSREAQETAVRELARRDGYNGELRVLVDWDRSADEAKEGKRAAFLAMLAAIERGEVSAVYAYALDRLYRSMRTFVRLTDAAKAHGSRIVTLREGTLGGDGSPMAQAFAQITAVFSELELNTTKARVAGSLAVRRKRGDHIGRVGYGYRLARNEQGAMVAVPNPEHPLEPIIAAVRDAGNIFAACRLLRERGIPSPDGKDVWTSLTLRRIVEREAPELIPPVGPTGRHQPTHAALAQLLRCACGQVLTPEAGRHAYRCLRGGRLGKAEHGPCWVSERAIMPWIMTEAARLRTPERVELEAQDGSRREASASRLERAHELYIAGDIDRARYDAEKARAMADLEVLDAAQTIVTVPEVDWSWPPEAVNNVLRALWSEIRLDEHMRPLEAIWRVPEWRA